MPVIIIPNLQIYLWSYSSWGMFPLINPVGSLSSLSSLAFVICLRHQIFLMSSHGIQPQWAISILPHIVVDMTTVLWFSWLDTQNLIQHCHVYPPRSIFLCVTAFIWISCWVPLDPSLPEQSEHFKAGLWMNRSYIRFSWCSQAHLTSPCNLNTHNNSSGHIVPVSTFPGGSIISDTCVFFVLPSPICVSMH